MSTEEYLDSLDHVRLDEMSKEEFCDVVRILNPDYTDADAEQNWLEFQSLKRAARESGTQYLYQ